MSDANDPMRALAKKIAAKVSQLENYRDNGCIYEHPRAIAEGRLQQANQILHWIAEAASLPPQPQPEARDVDRKTATFWRDDALETAALIVMQYKADPAIAFDIRALKSGVTKP